MLRDPVRQEDVAAETPELIFTETVDIEEGLREGQLEGLAANMGFEGESIAEAADVMAKLYEMFIASDATLVEINPLAETNTGEVMVCDAKLNFDDNAEFRQKPIFAHRDRKQPVVILQRTFVD